MKFLLLSLALLLTGVISAQKLRFKVTGVKDTTVFLTRYYGKGLYYADTAVMKNGVVEFTAKPDLKPGVLALLLKDQKYFDFIYNKEEVSLETEYNNFVPAMKVKKSVENKLFMDYINFIASSRSKATTCSDELKKLTKDSPEYKAKQAEIEAIGKAVEEYQANLIKMNPTTLTSKIVKMSMDVKIPEMPKDKDGKEDPNARYYYFRQHYWDNIDLKDDRLVNSPIFHNKLETYFGKTMLVQSPDTIIKVAFPFCDQFDKESEMFKYCVDYITNTSAKSNIMGMNKAYYLMVDRYYCKTNPKTGKSFAHWMKDDKLDELCKDNKIKMLTMMGAVPPNISLRDTTDVNWKDFYSLKSEYTILYFWDPECGHCKKTTPKLQELYAKKLKARNVEIFAVGKATGDDFEKWKKFIRDHNLQFINVGMTKKLYEEAQKNAAELIQSGKTTLEALNYHDTYDIYATPKILVLDKDKKIVAEKLTISQLEDFLDRMQNIKDPVKLFPEDPEELEHNQN